MNVTFKRGSVYTAPRLGNHMIMAVSVVRSNNEDCLYCMATDGSYVTIPYWQLDYYKDISDSQYQAMKPLIESMKTALTHVVNNESGRDFVVQETAKTESAIVPPHYGGAESLYEAIKVIEAWDMNFCLGNVVKYISRAGKKDKDKELEDLLKAQWYLNKHIESWREENQ